MVQKLIRWTGNPDGEPANHNHRALLFTVYGSPFTLHTFAFGSVAGRLFTLHTFAFGSVAVRLFTLHAFAFGSAAGRRFTAEHLTAATSTTSCSGRPLSCT